jgi:tRNA threonylcarbamoyladenosine biosynthesis protein TsaB
MLILTIRTDKPQSEIGLFSDNTKLAYESWEAHRQLAETIHKKIDELLESQQKDLSEVRGIVVYKGPGSFTGLRIGISVANSLAYSMDIPIAAETDEWIESGIRKLLEGKSVNQAMPEYGSPVHVTQQKK